jgi:hypothetical protein
MTGAQALSTIRKLTTTTILLVIIDLAFPGRGNDRSRAGEFFVFPECLL